MLHMFTQYLDKAQIEWFDSVDYTCSETFTSYAIGNRTIYVWDGDEWKASAIFIMLENSAAV